MNEYEDILHGRIQDGICGARTRPRPLSRTSPPPPKKILHKSYFTTSQLPGPHPFPEYYRHLQVLSDFLMKRVVFTRLITMHSYICIIPYYISIYIVSCYLILPVCHDNGDVGHIPAVPVRLVKYVLSYHSILYHINLYYIMLYGYIYNYHPTRPS